MAEHFCKEHGEVFFMKGNMRGFAHPILAENGDKTGKWCNETEGNTTETPPPNRPVSGEERGMWWKELGEMIRANKVTYEQPNGKIFIAAYWLQMSTTLQIKPEKKGEE